MDFTYSERTQVLQAKLNAFMDDDIYPSEEKFVAEVEENRCKGNAWVPTKIMEELKEKARAQELWNLFLPESEYGTGLTNL
jgi:acyl-CoA dehydrogenase